MAINFDNLTSEQRAAFDAMTPEDRASVVSMHSGKEHPGRPLMQHQPEYFRGPGALARWHWNDYRSRLEKDEHAKPATEQEQAAGVERFKATVRDEFLSSYVRLKSGEYAQVMPETWAVSGALDAMTRGEPIELRVQYATGFREAPHATGPVIDYDAVSAVHGAPALAPAAIVEGPAGDEPADDDDAPTAEFVSSATAVPPPKNWALKARPLFLAGEIDVAHSAPAKAAPPAPAVEPDTAQRVGAEREVRKVGRPKGAARSWKLDELATHAAEVYRERGATFKTYTAFVRAVVERVPRAPHADIDNAVRTARDYAELTIYRGLGVKEHGWKPQR